MITAFVVQRQKMWLEAIQHRIAITSKMLDEMKSVKFSGLANVLASSIHQYRIEELQISKKYRKLLIINMVFSKCKRQTPAGMRFH
jgi:ATP-binding cassette, subfamily C (CFTR/MRP), member 1